MGSKSRQVEAQRRTFQTMSAQEEKKGGKRTPVKVVADAKPSIDKKTPGTKPSDALPVMKRSWYECADAIESRIAKLEEHFDRHLDVTESINAIVGKVAGIWERQQKEINEIVATVKSIKERLDADAHKKKMEERHKRASNEQAPSDRARILNGEDSD